MSNSCFGKQIDERILNLDYNLACLCVKKGIKIADKKDKDNKDMFLLEGREKILDYHSLISDSRNFVSHLFRNKAILTKAQMEEYSKQDFLKTYGIRSSAFAWNDYEACGSMDH